MKYRYINFLLFVLSVTSCAVHNSLEISTDMIIQGEYCANSGLGGQVLQLKSDSTYEYSTFSDMLVQGTKNPVYKGSYHLDGGQITLLPDDADSTFQQHYYYVQWGEFDLLIEKSKIIDFCNNFNSGWLQQENPMLDIPIVASTYLSKTVQPETPLRQEMPIVPASFENYILDTPLFGRVVQIDTTNCTLNIENTSNHQLLGGMELFLESGKIMTSFIVLESDKNHCTVVEKTIHSFKDLPNYPELNELTPFSEMKSGAKLAMKEIVPGDVVTTRRIWQK
jgi:hypothetical protein